jgi:hypothetical protein
MIPFEDYCSRVQHYIVRYYLIRVVTVDVPDPLTGDLDGAQIQIDFALSPEQRLFLLGHLFGHTVQWNVNPRAFEIGRQREPPVSEDDLPEVMEYERDAACYALGMFHQAGVSEVDNWFSDYAACDMAYLRHYYRTGEKGVFSSFWREGAPLIEALPTPVFTPSKRIFRRDGVVI